MSRGLPDALVDDLAKIQQKTAGSANVDLTSEQRAILASDDVNVLKAELTKARLAVRMHHRVSQRLCITLQAFRTINDAFGGSMMQMETVKPLMGRPRPKVKQEDASNPYQAPLPLCPCPGTNSTWLLRRMRTSARCRSAPGRSGPRTLLRACSASSLALTRCPWFTVASVLIAVMHRRTSPAIWTRRCLPASLLPSLTARVP